MIACRDACANAGEPLAGSAGTAPVFVGLRWPKPLWHPDKAERSAGLPEGLVELLARESERRGKIPLRLFQRAPGPASDRVELLYADPRQAFGLPGLPLSEAADALATALAGGRPLGAEPLAPQLLVCTDGQHDRCCAAFGRPMFRALAAAGAERGIAVAESSHLGGHRFAPTCLALPGRELYGRLGPEDAPELCDALRAGRPLARALRGRLGESELEQVVRAALRERASPLAEAPVATIEQNTASASVTLAADDARIVVRCELRLFEGPGSCGEPAGEPKPRWLAVPDAAGSGT